MNTSRTKKLILVGIVVAILLILPVTIFLTQQQQDNRQRASGNTIIVNKYWCTFPTLTSLSDTSKIPDAIQRIDLQGSSSDATSSATTTKTWTRGGTNNTLDSLVFGNSYLFTINSENSTSSIPGLCDTLAVSEIAQHKRTSLTIPSMVAVPWCTTRLTNEQFSTFFPDSITQIFGFDDASQSYKQWFRSNPDIANLISLEPGKAYLMRTADGQDKTISIPSGYGCAPVLKMSLACELGDIDGDGAISEFDLNAVNSIAAGSPSYTPEQSTKADLDKSGAVNSTDTSIMGSYLSGDITTLPGCTTPKPSPCGFFGDINKDGIIDIQDLSAIQRIARAQNKPDNSSYTDEEKKLANLDGKNDITIFDALIASNYIKNNPTVSTFPICSILQIAGPNNPSIVEQVSTTDTSNASWKGLENIKTSDDKKATVMTQSVTGSRMISNSLIAKGFGFAIPSDAIIKGVIVEIERRTTSSPGSKTYALNLTKDGTKNPAGSVLNSNSSWPFQTESYQVVGDNNNLWQTTFTPSEINSPNFGVVLAVKGATGISTSTAEVDHIRVSIAYSFTPTSETPTPTVTNTPATITAQTGSSTNITTNSATLNGTASSTGTSMPSGLTIRFVYSPQNIECSAMTNSIAIPNINLQQNSVQLSSVLTGLIPNRQYYTCVHAVNGTTNIYGSKVTFTTLNTTTSQCNNPTQRPNGCACQQPSNCASNFCSSSAQCATGPQTPECEYKNRGDYDCNSYIELADLTLWAQEKEGTTVTTKKSDIAAPIGTINIVDLSPWIESYLTEFRKKP